MGDDADGVGAYAGPFGDGGAASGDELADGEDHVLMAGVEETPGLFEACEEEVVDGALVIDGEFDGVLRVAEEVFTQGVDLRLEKFEAGEDGFLFHSGAGFRVYR